MDRLSSPLLLLFANLSAQGAATMARPEWQRHFDARGVAGTFVLLDPARDRHLATNEARGRQRFAPGATFEVAAALIGLETGAIADEREVFAWDGKPKPRPAWERDQSLPTAMRDDAAWMFQQVARRIGKSEMREWLRRLEYGNASVAGGIDHFWLQGGLRISAYEQVRFLHRLAEGRLGTTQRAQRLVRQALLVEKTREVALYAKRGSVSRSRDAVDWWVGWIERKGKPTGYFALNHQPAFIGGSDDSTGRALLRDAGVFP